MNKRATCTGCVHRRPMTAMTPHETVCHYLPDTGEPRGCPAGECTRWQPTPDGAVQWLKLLKRIKEADNHG